MLLQAGRQTAVYTALGLWGGGEILVTVNSRVCLITSLDSTAGCGVPVRKAILAGSHYLAGCGSIRWWVTQWKGMPLVAFPYLPTSPQRQRPAGSQYSHSAASHHLQRFSLCMQFHSWHIRYLAPPGRTKKGSEALISCKANSHIYMLQEWREIKLHASVCEQGQAEFMISLYDELFVLKPL